MTKPSSFDHVCVVCGHPVNPGAGTAGDKKRGDYVVLPKVVEQGRSVVSVYRHKTCALPNDAPTPLVKGTRNNGACDTCGSVACDGTHPASEVAFVQPALPDLPDEARPAAIVTLPGEMVEAEERLRPDRPRQLSMFGGE